MQRDEVLIPAFARSYLATLGIDMGEVLRLANLPTSLLHDGKATVTTCEYFAIWRAFEQMGAPADLSLQIGTSGPPPGQYDVASIAALHSANFGEAIAKVAKYKRLVCPALWTIETRGSVSCLNFRWGMSEVEAPALITDGALAYVASLFARGTGRRLTPIRVELTRRTGHRQMLMRHFGCDVLFNRPLDRLFFDSKLLDEPFLTHNPDLLDLMVPGLEALLRSELIEPSWVSLTKEAIGRVMQGRRPGIEVVASELCVSARTLQRRLEDAGTTYQQLLDQVRHAVANSLLTTTDMSSGEIAFLLGFEELNSFTRAFQRWAGSTPNQWRASNVARRDVNVEAAPRDLSRGLSHVEAEVVL
jgi:AraC-like DNA-binding protein